MNMWTKIWIIFSFTFMLKLLYLMIQGLGIRISFFDSVVFYLLTVVIVAVFYYDLVVWGNDGEK